MFFLIKFAQNFISHIKGNTMKKIAWNFHVSLITYDEISEEAEIAQLGER